MGDARTWVPWLGRLSLAFAGWAAAAEAPAAPLSAVTVVGGPLPLGKLPLPPGVELLAGSEEAFGAGSWATKDRGRMEAFVKLRLRYLEDEAMFASFRRGADSDGGELAWGGGDGAYGKWTQRDAAQMILLMQRSPWGTALLERVLPRIRGRVDGFGSPHLVWMERYGLVSPDLFDGLFKLMLILQSLSDFAPLPGQPPVPTPEDVRAGPGRASLFKHWDLLEVGAGPGLPAATLVAAMRARTYSIVDLPTQQAMQRKVLTRALGELAMNSTFAFVPCSQRPPGGFVLSSYDLFISTYAFSELHPEVRMRYFYTFVIRSRRGFVIDNFQDLRDSNASHVQDAGDFVGLDFVGRLQDFGFDVRISTYQQVLGLRPHRSRAVVITWASLGLEGILDMKGFDR